MIKLGVDNGNYNTKSSEGMLYASGYAVSDKEFITPEMQLFYEGKYYAVGERRLRFQQDKTKEPDTFILTLPAIAEAMKRTGAVNAEIILGVGLPIDSYGTQKDAFRRYFLRDDLSFVFEGTTYRCRIADCKVFAQGHAALCRYYQQLKEYRSITLVDIGGYTVDVLTVHNFRLDRSSCASLRMGTITLYSRIQDALQKNDILLSDELITDAIRGQIQHADRGRIETVVERSVAAYCKELFNALRERGLDLKLPTVFAGGGAELLESRLRGEGINTVTVLNRFANADGYRLLMG
ncbi:ParM/StbA family protein [Caproiciproducens sp. NJN-50]|uniref:ParM/StbA family protein n=1 Tax=Caproiciproducens sp. NJN-50 TaxID=2507162 RepID=UPI000FFE27AB|nr:ParM/StbA family protein [Caproiciproducens sp. NJN-50]QAT49900.1 ParM/StbA family protein [Caproiciproducens sp. NJN-50]